MSCIKHEGIDIMDFKNIARLTYSKGCIGGGRLFLFAYEVLILITALLSLATHLPVHWLVDIAIPSLGIPLMINEIDLKAHKLLNGNLSKNVLNAIMGKRSGLKLN